MRCLKIPPPKIQGGQCYFIDAPASAPRLEQKVTFGVRLCVTKRRGANLAGERVGLVHPPGVANAQIPTPEPSLACSLQIQI